MKKQRTQHYRGAIVALLLGLFCFVLPLDQLAAAGQNSVTIHRLTKPQHDSLLRSDRISSELGDAEAVVGARFKIWLVDAGVQAQGQEQARLALAATLDRLSETELDSAYGSALVSEPTDTRGQTTLSALADGRWYARESLRTAVDRVALPFVFDLPFEGQTHIDIYPKETRLVQLSAAVRLFKYTLEAGEKRPLAGVGFELYKKADDGTLRPICVDSSGSPLYEPSEDQLKGLDPAVKRVLYSDNAGEIYLGGLALGHYEWKEVAPLPAYELPQSNLSFELDSFSELRVEMENHPLVPLGGKRFLKTEQNKNEKVLGGARFKLTRELVIDGKKFDQPVQRNGADYLVTSAADGTFAVTDLPYGRYALWETKAPSGYDLLEAAVYFEVNEHSLNDGTVLVIENKPSGGHRFVIPRTGELTVFLMFISGAILILIGAWLLRLQKN